MGSLRRHLTVANVLSSIALFVALGGSSYAAISTGADEPAGEAPAGVLESSPEGVATAPPADLPPAQRPTLGDDGLGPGSEPKTEATQGDPALPLQAEEPARDEEAGPEPDKAGRDDRGRDDGDEDGHGGPPPWAPAHGWRCKQAGNTPGSASFRDCVKSKTH